MSTKVDVSGRVSDTIHAVLPLGPEAERLKDQPRVRQRIFNVRQTVRLGHPDTEPRRRLADGDGQRLIIRRFPEKIVHVRPAGPSSSNGQSETGRPPGTHTRPTLVPGSARGDCLAHLGRNPGSAFRGVHRADAITAFRRAAIRRRVTGRRWRGWYDERVSPTGRPPTLRRPRRPGRCGSKARWHW